MVFCFVDGIKDGLDVVYEVGNCGFGSLGVRKEGIEIEVVGFDL